MLHQPPHNPLNPTTLGLVRARQLGGTRARLPALHPQLNAFLDGGLALGKLAEFGMPLGREGRRLLLPFLAQAGLEQWYILWINGHSRLRPYPPAWFARGVVADRFFLADSCRPLRDLQRALLRPPFRLLIFDVGRRQLGGVDCAQLQRAAAKENKIMVVLRDHFLSPNNGNPWAALRCNAWRRAGDGPFLLRRLDNGRTLRITEEELP